jgi:hypothetical protein
VSTTKQLLEALVQAVREGNSAQRAQMAELQASVNASRDLTRIQVKQLADLATTARFQRGGYDGPILRTATHTASEQVSRLFGGMSEPAALTIEWLGTGNANEFIFINDDQGAVQGGWRFARNVTHSISTGNPIRLIAEAHQILWMKGVFLGGEGTHPMRVYVSKL